MHWRELKNLPMLGAFLIVWDKSREKDCGEVIEILSVKLFTEENMSVMKLPIIIFKMQKDYPISVKQIDN